MLQKNIDKQKRKERKTFVGIRSVRMEKKTTYSRKGRRKEGGDY